MERDKTTSEEKLLHLIENPTLETKKKFKPPFKRKASLDFSRLSLVIKEFWLKRQEKVLTPKFANKALMGLCVVVTLFVAFDFMMGSNDVRGLYLAEKGLIPSEAREDEIAESLPLNEYLYQIRKRDIFVSYEKEFPIDREGEAITVTSLAEGLSLVGILWSGTPQAMIEDTNAGKTHILKKGDTINNVFIKDILRDRVILGYQNEEMEMR